MLAGNVLMMMRGTSGDCFGIARTAVWCLIVVDEDKHATTAVDVGGGVSQCLGLGAQVTVLHKAIPAQEIS